MKVGGCVMNGPLFLQLPCILGGLMPCYIWLQNWCAAAAETPSPLPPKNPGSSLFVVVRQTSISGGSSLFVVVRRCSSLFVVVRQTSIFGGSSLFVVVRRCSSLFVVVRR